jgi:predicted thioesterase
MKCTLVPGVRGEHRHRVVSENLVSHHNPNGPAVLGTPFLLLLMETAAWRAMSPHLDAGEDSVGVGFDFRHLAPTPPGMNVVAKAEVLEVNGQMVTLSIEAHDEHERIGEGTHVRAVIDVERFKKRHRKKVDG